MTPIKFFHTVLQFHPVFNWDHTCENGTEGYFLRERKTGGLDRQLWCYYHCIKRQVFKFLLAKITEFLSKTLLLVFAARLCISNLLFALWCVVDGRLGSTRECSCESQPLWQVYQGRYYPPISIFRDVHHGYLTWYLKMPLFKITIWN